MPISRALLRRAMLSSGTGSLLRFGVLRRVLGAETLVSVAARIDLRTTLLFSLRPSSARRASFEAICASRSFSLRMNVDAQVRAGWRELLGLNALVVVSV